MMTFVRPNRSGIRIIAPNTDFTAPPKLPNSLCRALNLAFDELVPLLILAEILHFKPKKAADGSSGGILEFKTGGIESLVSNFFNLDIDHTYIIRKPGETSPYSKCYFIGRGERKGIAIYGKIVSKIKSINYSDKQKETIAELRTFTVASHPFLRYLSIANEEGTISQSLQVDTSLPRTQNAGDGSAAIVTPTETEQRHGSTLSEADNSQLFLAHHGVTVTPTNAAETSTSPYRPSPNTTRDGAVAGENTATTTVTPADLARHNLIDADEAENLIDAGEAESPGSVSAPPNQSTSRLRVRSELPLDQLAVEHLDFSLIDDERPPRVLGQPPVLKTSVKRATTEMRTFICGLARDWGYDKTDSKIQQNEIAEAACKAISYDAGFEKPIKGSNFSVWYQDYVDQLKGRGKKYIKGRVEVKKMGPKTGTYVEKIEALCPGYLHKTYRQAIKKASCEGSWIEIATAMNEIAFNNHQDDESLPVLALTKDKGRVWFKENRGTLKKRISRPILTSDRKLQRIEWCRGWFRIFSIAKRQGKRIYIAWLDEKWFYTRSGRKKAKFLPLGPGERPGDDDLPVVRTASRRFPSKTMFLAVIAKPEPEHAMDGKIKLLRLSRTDVASKRSCTELFSDITAINEDIKRNWRLFVEGDTVNRTVAEITAAVADKFDLSGDIAEKLVLRYRTFGVASTKSTLKSVPPEKKLANLKIRAVAGGELRPLTLADVILKLQREAGDSIEKDVNCDSVFMAAHMESIGEAIREKYFWVPKDESIYLIMDNAGGHGTKDAIEKYVQLLKDEYNVIIQHQTPRSPEFNLCDLGFFNCLQSAVEKQHRGKRTHNDVLAKTVFEAWEQIETSALTKIYERWLRVLTIVEQDGGDNKSVDKYRGELFTAIFGAIIEAREKEQADDGDSAAGSDDEDENGDDDESVGHWREEVVKDENTI